MHDAYEIKIKTCKEKIPVDKNIRIIFQSGKIRSFSIVIDGKGYDSQAGKVASIRNNVRHLCSKYYAARKSQDTAKKTSKPAKPLFEDIRNRKKPVPLTWNEKAMSLTHITYIKSR